MRHFFFALGLFLPLVYQNCAQAPQDETSKASSFSDKLPFGFKVKMDTIAYMSCSAVDEQSINSRAYFTFRVGAYNPSTGGLAMSDEFRDYTKYYNSTDRGRALGRAARNSNTLMSLSIRERKRLQSPWTSQTGAIPGYDLDPFLPDLIAPEVTGPLAAAPDENTLVNYFPGAQDKRLIEASLRFFKGESDSRGVRSDLGSGKALLTVGFTQSADDTTTELRGPSNFEGEAGGTLSQTSVYGVGYAVGFGTPARFTTAEPRVLSTTGLTEVNLLTDTAITSDWTCSATYQFMIVRPEDIANEKATCYTGVDRAVNASQRTALSAIRRVLRTEDWYVDLTNRCVVPKSTGDYCYGTEMGNKEIDYYETACPSGTGRVCPHFVSVCVRN